MAALQGELNEDQDIFKTKPYRYLGYANEVGESFRHVVPRSVVNGSYAIASTYVIAHAIHKGYNEKESRQVYTTVVDTLLWQGLASVAIPGLTINRICASSRWCLNRLSVRVPGFVPPVVRSWGVIVIGLGSIPLIINPIDRFVDKFLDGFIRPYYGAYKES